MNTTILFPGSCNANCDFCFWDRDMSKIRPEPSEWINKVFENFKKLPEGCDSLSISGGEPTLSPYFKQFLTKLTKHKPFKKVVLTTNGSNIFDNLHLIGAAVDHINISRHAVIDEENSKIFKSKAIPSTENLKTIISLIHAETECDVTLNGVVQPDVSVRFCNEFIAYTKSIGAEAVSFRKVAGDITPTFAEYSFVTKYGIASQTSCPVCRGVNQLVDGFDVRWKSSVTEPSNSLGEPYEVVIAPDGEMYSDWGMKQPFKPKLVKKFVGFVEAPTRSYGSCGSSGCGSGGCK